MLDFLKSSQGHMKSKFSMESLTKPELLMLFSILEGELEARDLVIDALKSQRKELFIQERYGRYNLSDPFLALQRDSEAVGGQNKDQACSSPASNPLVVLKLVVSHCRRMQEKMLAQLAAAESRHRRVIADLEEEKRRHAEDTAEGDDVTYILEKEKERLQQQLEFERSQVRRLEKEQRRLTDQLEEERAQYKQLSCALAKECKWASARALEEGHRLAELSRKLDKEKESCQALARELEEERRRALRMEARVEEQLAEFDTEREQLRSRLKKEEAHCCQLQQQVEELNRKLEEVSAKRDPKGAPEREWATKVSSLTLEDVEDVEDAQPNSHSPTEANGHEGKSCPQNGEDLPPPSPCTSPLLTKRPAGGYQSPYQAGINQRFHAARHKFQGSNNPEADAQPPAAAAPQPPKEASPAPPTGGGPPTEGSPVKQMARSTVTQVLSRFTTAMQTAAARAAQNNSPFGTDYRSLAASPAQTSAPGVARATAARSPTVPRADRGHPPPVPPKKPGLAQAPASPATSPRSGGHHPGSCGLTSGQDAVKELDMVVSSN